MSKISDMQGSSPLEGNELVPVVQSGVNVTTTPDAIAELVEAGMEIVGSLPDPTTEDIGKFVLFEGSIWVVVDDGGTNVFQQVSGGAGPGGYSSVITTSDPITIDETHDNALILASAPTVVITLPGDASDPLPIGFTCKIVFAQHSGTTSDTVSVNGAGSALIARSTGWSSAASNIGFGAIGIVTKVAENKWLVAQADHVI